MLELLILYTLQRMEVVVRSQTMVARQEEEVLDVVAAVVGVQSFVEMEAE